MAASYIFKQWFDKKLSRHNSIHFFNKGIISENRLEMDSRNSFIYLLPFTDSLLPHFGVSIGFSPGLYQTQEGSRYPQNNGKMEFQ